MAQEKISVLFLAANPVNTPPLELVKEFNYVDEEIQKGKYDDLFQLHQKQAITAEQIQNTLLRFRPQIVHFSGHGSPAGSLVFQDMNGLADEISPSALTNLFNAINKEGNIRIVFLSACYSEKQARAIALHVDCVIGMKREVTDEAATKFAGSFYNALAHGESVKTAFDLARVKLQLEHMPEDKKPKLLTRPGVNASLVSVIPKPRHDRSEPDSQGINWTKWGIVAGIATGAITGIVALLPIINPPAGPIVIDKIIGQVDLQMDNDYQFQAKIRGGSPPYTYEWNFTDGSPISTLEEPLHRYARTGPFTIKLIATDSKGYSDNDGLSVTVTRDGTTSVDTTAPRTPDLADPENGEKINRNSLTLSWFTVSDPSGVTYTVEVYMEDNLVAFGDGLPTSSFTLDELSQGQYKWHVRAADGMPNVGNYSNWSYFDVDTTPPEMPILSSPTKGAIINNNRPTFQWEAIHDPSGVTYTMTVTAENLNISVDRQDLTSNAFALDFSLSESTYSWQVFAVDGAGNKGESSEVSTFTIDTQEPASTPALLSPVDDTECRCPGHLIRFTWTAVSDPSGVTYGIVVSKSTVFDSLSLVLNKTNLSEPLYEDRFKAGKYYWQVFAVDGGGNKGDSSQIFTFEILPS